jgi:AcrR family transcriptional regulator
MDKKQLVTETARKLFTKYGYKKVSMDEIAKQSGVTKKTIYTYFKDKEDLFTYFIFEELESIKKKVNKKEQEDLPFIEKVSSAIWIILSYRKKSAFFKNILEDNENANFIKIYDEDIIKFIEDKINKAIIDKYIKKCDAHFTAFIIYKIYLAIMFEYEEELDEEKVTKEITSILKDGLVN